MSLQSVSLTTVKFTRSPAQRSGTGVVPEPVTKVRGLHGAPASGPRTPVSPGAPAAVGPERP